MSDRTETIPGTDCVVTHRFAVINGVRLHYVEAGAQAAKGKDKLCVALHGFPEFWYCWRHQVPALAAAGYHVVAPDLRGYNESDKPPGLDAYRIEVLTADVAGLIRHLGEQAAVVAGHDWGGGIAWCVALFHPEVVRKLVILNAPHPTLFWRGLRRPAQLLKSWYMFFFQLPWLPEAFCRAGYFARFDQTLGRDPIRPGAFSPEDIRHYKRALAQPGVLTAAINYYRAAFRRSNHADPRLTKPIEVPTLVIWGERDRYLGLELLSGLEGFVPNLRLERLPDASHWVQNDAPEEVNRLLLEFIPGPIPASRDSPASHGSYT